MRLLCALLFIFVSISLQAQIQQSNRVEYLLSENEIGFEVIPINEDAVFLFREIQISNNQILEIQLLNHDLQLEWKGFIPVDIKLEISAFDVLNGNIALLLKPRSYYAANLAIIFINSLDGSYIVYQIDNPLPIFHSGFRITEYGALIGGYFSNRPLVYFFNFSTRQSKILPGFVNEAGEINQIQTYYDGTFDVITNGKYYENRKTLWLRHFTEEGNLIRSVIIQPDDKSNLLFGRSLTMEGNKQVVAGVYGRQNYDYSRGIFTGIYNDDGQQELIYNSYADLENFFNYLKAGRKERIQERIKRKKIKGKKIRLSYRLMVQEIFEDGDQFILLGQAFYPKYRTDNNRNLLYGNPYATNLIFDGYKYTHAVILGINKEGKILWDNSFEINDIQSFQLKQFVKAYKDEDSDQLIMLYLFDNIIRSKVIKGREVIEGKTHDPLVLKFTNDKIYKEASPTLGGLEHWFDNHFLAYGVQLIKHESTKGANFRKVFFINKISYQ